MANTANEVFLPGLAAAAAQSSSQFLAVKSATTSGQEKVVTATTDLAIGVLANAPARAGEGALVQVAGVTKWKAGTSVGWTANIAVGYNTTGQAMPIAANTTNDNRPVLGRFPLLFGNTTTVAVNQIISVQLFGAVQRI